MGKFIFGFGVGTVAGVMLFSQALAEIWKNNNWDEFSHMVDQKMSANTGRKRQLVNEDNISRYADALRGL